MLKEVDNMNNSIENAITIMTEKLTSILQNHVLGIYLYGSVPMNDFKLGWSDIDIICLTNQMITDKEAEELVVLRQTLLEENPNNKYLRSFEGAIVSYDEFKTQNYSKVVYWGTSGQRITKEYVFDTFSQYELVKYGRLLCGKDIRAELQIPTYKQLVSAVIEHYDTIRKYAVETDDSLYACGWLLDIARCIYTLRTGDVIAKTKAGEWALKEHLCPEEEQLEKTLQVRNAPLDYKEKKECREWLTSLGPTVQKFADVLELEISRKVENSYESRTF